MVATSYLRARFAQQAAGHALKAVDQFGQRYLWWVLDEKMDVIVLAVAFNQFCVEVTGYFGEDGAKIVYR